MEERTWRGNVKNKESRVRLITWIKCEQTTRDTSKLRSQEEKKNIRTQSAFFFLAFYTRTALSVFQKTYWTNKTLPGRLVAHPQ